MPTTPIQALPYPAPTDPPLAPGQIQALAQAIETRLNMVFASAADRDAKITTPTAGMRCWVQTGATGYPSGRYSFNGTGWFPESFAFVAWSNTATTTVGSSAGFVPTVVQFDTVDRDDALGWQAGSSAYRCPFVGIYRVCGSANTSANGVNARRIAILVNGGIATSRLTFGAGGTPVAEYGVEDTFLLQAGDTVQIGMGQNSGSTLTCAPVDGTPRFSVTWVRP